MTARRHSRNLASALVLLGTSAAMTAPARATDVSFIMDWAWQGPQAFALMARNEGCFEEGGVNITLDRGFGSGRVPVELASGTYNMGLGDINPSIKFRAENPDVELIAVAVMFSGSPLVAVVRADGPIQEPADFAGKRLAAPEVDAGRQLFPIFAGATGIDDSTIEWITVAPELREPMLVRGEADGVTGFITSTVPSLVRLGLPEEDLRIFRYAEYGAELYSSSILTTRAFADANPEAVATVVRCMIRGIQLAENDPEGAIEALAAHEPLTDKEVELGRWMITVNEMLRVPNTMENGIGGADPEYLQRSIMSVEDAYGLPNELTVEQLWDGSFLPPAEERMFLPSN